MIPGMSRCRVNNMWLLGVDIHREGIDAGDAQIAIGKDGTGDAAAALITTGGDLQ